MKLISWNVNGIRAIVKKNFFQDLERLDPDILCLQETKAQPHQVSEALEPLSGYEIYAHSAEKKGYSGTAVLTRTRPLRVSYGIGLPEHDTEGRVITLEFEAYFLIDVYVGKNA